MKTPIALPVALLIAAPFALFADEAVPKGQAFARYEGMMNRSPFAVATAATPPPQAPNFAKDLYIANAAKDGDEALVTLASNVDKNLKEYLSTAGPNKSGYSISNIEWSDRVGATKVTITKDGQFATLTFNQALLSQPVAAAAIPQVPTPPQPQVQAGVPAMPGATPIQTPITSVTGMQQPQTGGVRPAPIPTLPTPPPRVRGVIPRNPAAATPVPDDRAQLMQDQ